MKNRAHIWTGIFPVLGMLVLIIDSQTALNGAKDGIALCINTIIPSLFPFIVLTIMCNSMLLGKNIGILRLIGKCCGVPKGAESLLLLGIIGGYPIGAQSIYQAFQTGQVKRSDARHMLGFCNNAGPAFIFGMVSSLFSAPVVAWMIWVIHILSALLVGICLCVTAILLYFSEWLSKRRIGIGHEVGYKDAIIIGLAQAVAVLPGLSRSGTTIATGLLCGVKKESVTKFSFLMVLIPILGEAFLELVDILRGEVVSSLGLVPMLVGFLAAFVSGCLACQFMINIVRRQKLVYFAIYCLVAGMFAIVYGLC